MKKVLFTALLILVTGVFIPSCQKETDTPIPAQSDFPYILGCKFLPAAEYEAIPLITAPYLNLKILPFSVTLASPFVGDQGAEGSCVAFGTTYAGRSIDWYYTISSNSGYSYNNIFSPEYVYNQIKVSTCASGSYVTSGLNLLKAQGVCSWNSMPYTDEECSTQPNESQRAEAANYKISSYSRVSIDENSIKPFLAANKPVIVAGPVNNAFMYLGKNQVLGKFVGRSLGGHCYCLVGYDDAKKAFKFQNSWGPSWSSSGFGWISYKYVKSWWKEAYVITTGTP